MKTPIRSIGKGKVSIDLLALRDAISAGSLSDADRATAEHFLPGITTRLGTANAEPAEAATSAGGKQE
ncbi:MAG: hypothetical protein WAN65_01960 [Candidatus Sulfotelmatobacter sp.]